MSPAFSGHLTYFQRRSTDSDTHAMLTQALRGHSPITFECVIYQQGKDDDAERSGTIE